MYPICDALTRTVLSPPDQDFFLLEVSEHGGIPKSFKITIWLFNIAMENPL